MWRIRYHHSLESINKRIDFSAHILKEELRFGDFVLVETKNSTYYIHVLGDSRFLVSGGWFDRNGLSPVKVRINGCTWGGYIIKTDVFAACGMHLEFHSGLVTSPIQRAVVFHTSGKN